MTFTHKNIIFRTILNNNTTTVENEIKSLNLLYKFNLKMKKILKIAFSLLFVLIVTLIAVPYFLKDDIEQFIKNEINSKVKAKIDYDDLSLSLLSDFPNLHVKIKHFTIDGINEFEGVRLVEIDRFSTSLDAKKMFFNKDLEIKKIGISGADINIKVLKNGKANYDIVKPDTTNSDIPQKKTDFAIKIEKYHIDNANLSYLDKSSNIYLKIKKLQQQGAGIIRQNDYTINMKTSIDTLDVIFDDIHYINNARTQINNQLLIEDEFSKYTVKDADIHLNELGLTANLMIALKNNDIEMDIDYATRQNSLTELLSLVPKTYMPDLKGIHAEGTAKLKGFVKGIFNEKNYPAYGVDFIIKNGKIKYNDLPQAVENINLSTKIDFPGGNNLDKTRIDIPKIHFVIAGSATDGRLSVLNPMTDPYIDTHFKSLMDLSKIKQAVYLPHIKKLTGKLDADFKLKGRSSAIEKQVYDKFVAEGHFNLDQMEYISDSLKYDVKINKAQLLVNPQALSLQNFDSQVGKSDFHINGKIENYITYFIQKDKVLKARFDMHSDYLDMNEFMTAQTDETTTDSTQMSLIKIPDNLNLVFKADADRVRYKDMDLNRVKGTVKVKDRKTVLETVLMKTMGGNIKLKGIYDTSKPQAQTAMNLSMEKVSIAQSAQKVNMIKNYVPVMNKIQGNMFTDINLKVALDSQMNPIFNTLDAKGMLKTDPIEIGGIDVIKKIGNMLKIKALSKPKVDKIKAQFEIDKGNLSIRPFQFHINQIRSGLQGNVSVDQKINLVLNMDIPRQMLGGKANQILEGLVGKLDKLGLKADLGDIIKMQFKITGDITRPKIIPVIAGTEGQTTQEIITQAVQQKVEEAIDDAKLKAKAEAQKKADELMAKARIQADKIKSEAKKAADKIRAEAEKQANDLIKKAGNDPFKKLAAEALAKKIKKEAYKKANKLESEARSKADLIIQEAQIKADKLVQQID